MIRCSLDGAVLVAFEALGKVFKFEDWVIESQDTECGGVVLTHEGSWGEGRTEEEVGGALAAQHQQSAHDEEAEHIFFIMINPNIKAFKQIQRPLMPLTIHLGSSLLHPLFQLSLLP